MFARLREKLMGAEPIARFVQELPGANLVRRWGQQGMAPSCSHSELEALAAVWRPQERHLARWREPGVTTTA